MERRAAFSIGIVLNETMLGKSLIDAPLRLREALAAYGVHDYASQEAGTIVALPVTLCWDGDEADEEIRFSRPKTHGGRFSRVWITGSRRVARPGDLLTIGITSDAQLSASVSKVPGEEPVRPRGLEIGADVTAIDFSGYGGGRRLVGLLREHVLIVMRGMVECQPGHFMGASVAEIEDAADLGLDTHDQSRAVIKAILASLVRSGSVNAQKRGNSYYYTLVETK